MAEQVLRMWTVYDHPADFPRHFVARLHEVPGGPTETFMQSADLEVLREALLLMGLTQIPRDAADDPPIVETWV